MCFPQDINHHICILTYYNIVMQTPTPRTINVGSRATVVDETNNRSLLNGTSGSSTGKGSRGTEQGMQTYRGRYDKKVADMNNTISSNRNTLFQKPSKPAALDIEDSEWLFSMKVPRSDSSEDKYSIHALSALNNLGADEVESYPDDEEMAAECLKNKLRILGVARDTVPFQGGNQKQGLAIQYRGVSTHFANCDMPPGLLAELIIPLPHQLNRSEKPKKPHVEPDKVVLELRPYSARTVESKVMTHLKHYFKDENKYKRTMGLKHRTTSAWSSFIKTLLHGDIITWALITSHLAQRGIIQPISLGDHAAIQDIGEVDSMIGDTLILTLLKMLDVLQGGKASGADIKPAAHINIKESHMQAGRHLARELGMKVRFDCTTANLEFGYNKDTRSNPAKDEKGRANLGTPQGMMLYLQANHTPALVGGLSDVLNRCKEFVVGKIVKGAPAGRVTDICQ